MLYRPFLIEKTWANLKAKHVSESGFVDIVRSMFCGYHDNLNASKEKQRAFLRGLWVAADPNAQDAFLVAIEKGLRDIYEEEHKRNDVRPGDVEDTFASRDSHNHPGVGDRRIVLYEERPKTSLDRIREVWPPLPASMFHIPRPES